MHCPKCGCDLTLEDDFCPDCGENFEDMDDNEKKRVFNRPRPTSKKKINSIVDSGNVNGYIVEEGRSIKGGRLKKGSSTSKGGTRAVGYDVNTPVRKAIHNLNALNDKDEKNKSVKLTYEEKKKLESDVLGYEVDDDLDI